MIPGIDSTETIPCEKSILLWNGYLETSIPCEETDDFRIVVDLCCVWEKDIQHISNNTWFLLNSGAVILEQSMGARNRVGIDVVVPARRAT